MSNNLPFEIKLLQTMLSFILQKRSEKHLIKDYLRVAFKAFDTMNHPILLDKLNYYSVRGIANGCLKSFLADRKQFTTINAVSPGNLSITHEVPQ